MTDLEMHIQHALRWMRSLKGCPSKWQNILIIEDPLFTLRGKTWEIPQDAISTVPEFTAMLAVLLTI